MGKERTEGYERCASCDRDYPPGSGHFDQTCPVDLRLRMEPRD